MKFDSSPDAGDKLPHLGLSQVWVRFVIAIFGLALAFGAALHVGLGQRGVGVAITRQARGVDSGEGARIVFGARTTLAVSVPSVALAILFGLLFVVAMIILTFLLMRMKIFQAIKLGETT